MKRYRVTAECYYNNRVCQIGDEVVFEPRKLVFKGKEVLESVPKYFEEVVPPPPPPEEAKRGRLEHK
jgi:hypothetical protein